MTSKGLKLGILAGKIKKKFGDSENRETTPYHGTTVDEDALVNQKTAHTGHQKMTKSSSMGSINNQNDTSSDMIIVDQDDIITLTQDVKCFSDGLARLKTVFNDCTESPEDFKVTAHERLGEVLSILKNILHRYPALQSTELFQSSGTLITKVKSHNYGAPCNEEAEHAFCESIDQLALAFSSSVSEYLMGDLETSFQEEKDAKAKSYDNLLSPSKSTKQEEEEQPEVHLSAEEMDSILFKLQEGVDVALQRAYAWKKYMKDISQYIERKAQLEVEYSQKLSRLAASVKRGLSDEAFLPLQSVYCTSLSQDIDYASTCQATQAVLQTVKFVVPLTERRTEHDKMRKYVKDTWSKEMKKMQESVQNLRKAQLNYVTRQQEYEKAKEQSNKIETDMSGQSSNASTSSKIDKRRKTEEDALHKAVEAETTYKACVAEANSRQQELEKIKSELLAKVREELYLCDQVIQSVTIEYFRLLQTVSTPVPVQYHTLLETSKQYTPGVQYGEYIRRLSVQTNKSQSSEPFVFEPYVSSSGRDQKDNERKNSTQSGGSGSSEHHSPGGSPISAHKKDRYRIPVNAWGQGYMVTGETEGSPNSSPFPGSRRQLVSSDSLEGLAKVENGNPQTDFLAIPRTEGVDLHGILQVRGKRRNTTFGVDFQEQVEQCRSAVPPIVTKCLKEIEKRGMTMKGIYRVSVVKSKMESLCQQFERNPELVDLEDEHPNVISNVLKLYLRELPEPLLTFKLYSDFVHLAKESMSGSIDKGETISRLGDLIGQLPYSNFRTCAMLMHHLNRVTTFSSQNQMNASNLGIVFAPTLLRPLEGTASLASLVDTPHQTRIIELLIENVKDLFGPETDHQLIPGQTPIEDIADSESETQLPVSTPELSSFKSPQPLKSKVTKSADKTDSAKSSEKPVEHLLQTESANGDKIDSKNSDADFVLPGSAHCDKKETNNQGSPTITISEGEETGDLDLHSSSDDDDDDDDLPDTLLPDDSNPSEHASQAAFPVSYIKGGNAIVVPSTAIETMNADNLLNEKRFSKPSPPLHLKIRKESEAKINVPEIKILESTPTRDVPLPARFNISSSTNNGQRSKPKILVPSLQSLTSAEKRNSTTEKFKENGKADNADRDTQGPQSSILASNLQKSESKGSSRSPSLLRKFMATLEQSIDKISTIQSSVSDKKQSPPVQHKVIDSKTKVNETKLSPSTVHKVTESLEFVPAQLVTPLSSSYVTDYQGLQVSPSQNRKNAPSSNSAQLSLSPHENVLQNSQFSPLRSRKNDPPTTSAELQSFQLSPSSLRRSAVESVQSLYGDPDFSSHTQDSNISERSPMPSIKPPLHQSLFQGQTGFKTPNHSSNIAKTVEEFPFKINPPIFDASQSLAKSLPSPILQRQSAAQSSPLTIKQGLVSPNLSPILPRHPPVQFKLSLVTLSPTSGTDIKSKSLESLNSEDIITSTLKGHDTNKQASATDNRASLISDTNRYVDPVSQVEQNVLEIGPSAEQCVPAINPQEVQRAQSVSETGQEVDEAILKACPKLGSESKSVLSDEMEKQISDPKHTKTRQGKKVESGSEDQTVSKHLSDAGTEMVNYVNESPADLPVNVTVCVAMPVSTKPNVTSEAIIVCTSQTLDLPAAMLSFNDTSLSDSIVTALSQNDNSSVHFISSQKDPIISTDSPGLPTSSLLPEQQSLSVDSKQTLVKTDPIVSPPVPPRLFPELRPLGTAPVDVSNVSAFCGHKSTSTESEIGKDGQKNTVLSVNRIDNNEKVDKKVELPRQMKTEMKPAKVRPPIPNKPAVVKMSIPFSNTTSHTVTNQTTVTISSNTVTADSTPTTLDMTIRSADVSEVKGKLSPRYRVKVKNTVAPTSTTQAIPSAITSVLPPDLTVKSAQMHHSLKSSENNSSVSKNVSDFTAKTTKTETKVNVVFNISESSHSSYDTKAEVTDKITPVTSNAEVDITSDTEEKVIQNLRSEMKVTDNPNDLSQGLSVSDSAPPAPDMTVKYAGTGRGRPAITTKTTLSPAKVGVPGKIPKGPSGIVMGKADIMRGRGGNMKSTIGPNLVARRPSKGCDILPGQTKVKGHGNSSGSGTTVSGLSCSQTQRKLSSGTGTYPPTGIKNPTENRASTVSCSSCNRKRNSATDVSMPCGASSLTVQSGKPGSKVLTQKSVAGRKSPNEQSKSSKSDIQAGKKFQVQKVPPMKRGPGSAVKEKRTPFFV